MAGDISGVNPFFSQGNTENIQKPGSSFLDRIKTISLFTVDEKSQKQQTLNNALSNRNSIFE